MTGSGEMTFAQEIEAALEADRDPAFAEASMSARAIRRLACTAGLAVVGHDEDGEESAVSGRTRRVPPKLRRLLLARDRTCRFPGCEATRNLHAHHIIHWADGGPTEPGNLVLLCSFHHHRVHEGGWTIHHDGTGRFRFSWDPRAASGARSRVCPQPIPWPPSTAIVPKA